MFSSIYRDDQYPSVHFRVPHGEYFYPAEAHTHAQTDHHNLEEMSDNVRPVFRYP